MAENMDESQVNPEDEFNFYVDRAKQGRAKCKKCKQVIEKGSLRLAKTGANPFGTGKMKLWHHLPCIVQVFERQRASTIKIAKVEDIGGWHQLPEQDQSEVLKHLPPEVNDLWLKPKNNSGISKNDENSNSSAAKLGSIKQHPDNLFGTFCWLCEKISQEPSYNAKTSIIRKFFKEGMREGKSFRGDLELWCRMLLPGAVKRVYNLQSKQLVKLFSRLFVEDQDAMLESLDQGDVANTIRIFFENSKICKPIPASVLTLQEVDNFLENLARLTREEDQLNHFQNICRRCASADLEMIVRLVKHDIRINAGPKHILDAIDPIAYQAFQACRDLSKVVRKILPNQREEASTSSSVKQKLSVSISILSPVLPMLAEACKCLETAAKKHPEGLYAEIKYDGERVQLHKSKSEFKFFSRSLKPVLSHKVEHFKEFIPKAFPNAQNLILDCEVLMVDVKTGKPLPFGSLGKHKRNEFQEANPCLFVFDCIYYNGESLLNRHLKDRKKILYENMKEIKNHIHFSEANLIKTVEDLEEILTNVLQQGLEGLVLKSLLSTYEPGKRHWMKVKKDYLFQGKLADTADLVVLGAWYGTGSRGGMKSVFLMGCYDEKRNCWCTVTKVHSGYDDKTLERLQDELVMTKISKDATKVPKWLNCSKVMVPDFVAPDPKDMPVWEITGAEFTKNKVHTADGISIRFPRLTRIREDKDWKTATSLPELKMIYEKSKEYTNFQLPSSKTVKRKATDTPDSFSTDTDNSSIDSSMPMKFIASSSPKCQKMTRIKEKKLQFNQIIKPKEIFAKARILNPTKPLPDVLNGVKLFTTDPDSFEGLSRHIIAYGGLFTGYKDGIEKFEETGTDDIKKLAWNSIVDYANKASSLEDKK